MRLVHLPRQFGFVTGAILVVASMIGSGVFTTTGFLVRDIGSFWAVLLVWVVAGAIALCGALAYAELAAALPDNGGEYQLLSRIYHPAVGFTAGWVSLIAGFSAPMAAAAVAFGQYVEHLLPGMSPRVLALLVLAFSGVMHGARVGWGAGIQNAATVLNIFLILAFVVAVLMFADGPPVPPAENVVQSLMSPDFAVGLVYVSFAYSGWNAAVYVVGELREPERNLPRALIAGTLLVVFLYTGLNGAFLMAAPMKELSGVVDVGYVAARHGLGEWAARGMSLLVSIGLFTTVSALFMTGPRVYEKMGRDYPRLRLLAGRGFGEQRGPVAAIVLQLVVAVGMVLTASYDALLTYMGMMLSAFAGLTVIGVIVLRKREPELKRPYRMAGYPWTALLALLLSAWMLAHTLWQRPLPSLLGLATTLLGVVIYFWARGSADDSSSA